jgi:hypothetical protein
MDFYYLITDVLAFYASILEHRMSRINAQDKSKFENHSAFLGATWF